MSSELVVDVQPKEISIALLENNRLVELQKEARNISFSVGDIYLGRVKKLMPGLNAAFVDVGYEKDAFLHYLDLGTQYNSSAKFLKQSLADRKRVLSLSKFDLLPDIEKDGTINDSFEGGSKKCWFKLLRNLFRLRDLALRQRFLCRSFLVLIPFSDKVSVSQKIKSNEEKLRLRQLIQSIKPRNFGVIVRTVAEGKRVAELNNELKTLVRCWEDMLVKLQKAQLPSLVYEETGRTVGILRDIFSPSFENIYVNDKETYNQIYNYVSLISPDRKDIVKLYDGELPIFDNFAITKQIKSSLGKTVSFKSGAYVIIEHTEALHVIDVNSGNRSKASSDQESNALDVNMNAAEEIARQLRLRDMGGIIVIDFIDMDEAENRQKLYDRMRELMANDRARHNILPLSKFGLMQITRQRVRPALDIITSEDCPTCHGKGTIPPSLLFTDLLESKIHYLVYKLKIKKFTLHVHPFVAAYVNQGVFSLKMKWRCKYTFQLKVIP